MFSGIIKKELKFKDLENKYNIKIIQKTDNRNGIIILSVFSKSLNIKILEEWYTEDYSSKIILYKLNKSIKNKLIDLAEL